MSEEGGASLSLDKDGAAAEALETTARPQAEQPAQDASSQARRLDEDRWLASRFASRVARDRLTALYAVTAEIARAADGVAEPMLAQMRLTWWRSALEAMLEGRETAQPPSVRELAIVQQSVGFDRSLMLGLADARIQEIGAAPFATWADLDGYIDATAGATVRLAFQAMEPNAAGSAHQVSFARAVGRAWGYTGLLRSLGFWRAQGRSFFPTRMATHFHLDQAEFQQDTQSHRPQAAIRALMDRAVGAYREAQRLQVGLPAHLYPAYGYVAFTPAYLAALETAPSGESVSLPLFQRQATLIWRSLRGAL
jgi:phytoene synthase